MENVENTKNVEENTLSDEKSQKFVEISTKIAEIGSQYEEIDDFIYQKFNGMFRTFLSLMAKSNGKDIKNVDLQMKIFEDFFDINISEYVQEELEKAVKSFEKEQGNINKETESSDIDENLLKSIKSNISEYLKD